MMFFLSLRFKNLLRLSSCSGFFHSTVRGRGGRGPHTRLNAARTLETLKSEGRLLTAGPNPLPDNPERVSGSLIVAQFASLDAAEAWAEDDPYVHAGVYMRSAD
ncbi:unnamed protein product [Neisseria lactamica Y92-1009]|nr:unnamed protein product [Neisseria lactamica Y92-1009]